MVFFKRKLIKPKFRAVFSSSTASERRDFVIGSLKEDIRNAKIAKKFKLNPILRKEINIEQKKLETKLRRAKKKKFTKKTSPFKFLTS